LGARRFLQDKIEETKQWGRDHHPYAFTLWMAGGALAMSASLVLAVSAYCHPRLRLRLAFPARS
jgi:hypothetical protein